MSLIKHLKKMIGWRTKFSAYQGESSLHCFLLLLLSVVFCFSSCHSGKRYTIYYGGNATATEKAVCEELGEDIERVTGGKVTVAAEPASIKGSDYYIMVGSPATSHLVAELAEKKMISVNRGDSATGGGMIKVVGNNSQQVLVLAGNNEESVQNTVYDFSTNELGIDPLSYWTGSSAVLKTGYNPYTANEKIVKPSSIPIICYFENDVDELANMKKPYLEYDMETWKQMVNSLRRMHYNCIQLFDMLGRPEFFIRDPYKKIRPDYHANLPLVDSFISYAHLKGMKIQVDMSLGYEVKAISDTQALCWSRYKKDWIDTWVYYLTKTPLGKADMFSLRPRNQVWDREYISSCGENKEKVFNEVFAAFDSVMNVYRPGAPKICICYSDGMDMFNNGFNPPKDFIIAWSDNGYCDFSTLPASNKGYDFGTYMHAGFWKNHTVHDPYPEKIDSVMSFMAATYNATAYLQVNGQTFRPFLLNLDAFGQWGHDPVGFDGIEFMNNWCNYYFDSAAVPYAIASMNTLHEGQFGRNGYVQNLSEIKRMIGFLSSDKKEKPDTGLKNNEFFTELPLRLASAQDAYKQAAAGMPFAKHKADFYHDFIYLPALMYQQLLEFETTLADASQLKWSYLTKASGEESIEKAKVLIAKGSAQLKEIYKTCMEGDKNKKWDGWYDPVKRRPNNGFPDQDMIKSIQESLNKITNG